MHYRTIRLALSVDAARRRILDRVDGIRSTNRDGTVEFTSPSGFRLATLTESELPDGTAGSRLTYRTTMLTPVASRARRQARQIRDAVDDHRIPGVA